MMRIYCLSLLLCLMFFSCQTEPKNNWKPLNLLQYDIPLTILAPDSAKVKTMDLLVQKDVTIKQGDDYYIQIFASDAVTTDHKKIVRELKADVQNNPYFSKFVFEEEDGFIYETTIDSTFQSFSFRQVRIQGDREFIFRTGLVGDFTEEQVRKMYDAVKPRKK